MSQYDHPAPTSFLLDDEKRQLILTWSDEHESIHSWEALRWACPCAWCAGSWQNTVYPTSSERSSKMGQFTSVLPSITQVMWDTAAFLSYEVSLVTFKSHIHPSPTLGTLARSRQEQAHLILSLRIKRSLV